MDKVPVVEMQPKCRKLKWYWWMVIIVGSMILGASMKSTPNQQVSTKNTCQTQTITKEIPVDTTNWKVLKEVDDKLLLKSSDGFGILSDSMNAVGNFDFATIEKNNKKLESLTGQVSDLGNQRQEILSKLGY